jgi:hypothetical protein
MDVQTIRAGGSVKLTELVAFMFEGLVRIKGKTQKEVSLAMGRTGNYLGRKLAPAGMQTRRLTLDDVEEIAAALGYEVEVKLHEVTPCSPKTSPVT